MFFPKRLVFSGGGTQCLAFLPTLLRLEKQNQLSQVHEWWGTSAGSLLASLLAITRSAHKVNDLMRQTDFTRFRDVNLMNIVDFKTAWGFDNGVSFQRELERVFDLAKSGSSKMKLAEVENLHIPVCDITKHKTIICSSKTYPDLRIVDAVRASMSLPFFYVPFRNPENGNLWIDGGVNANFCWAYLPSDEARKESLGFAFERSWNNGPKTLSEYIFSILHFGEPEIMKSFKENWKRNIIWYASPPFPAWYMRIQKEEYDLLDQISDQAYRTWLTAYSSNSSESHLKSEVLHIPPSGNHQNCKDGRSDTPLCLSQPQQRYPSQDLPPKIQPLSRRWSV